MDLIGVVKHGSCKFVKCRDDDLSKVLRSYGFISGVQIKVVSKNKHGLVVEVLGTKYSINLNMAKIIEVE